ncbi:MAG: hypothetical protein OES26_11305 [Gammaproteobacteria bacterium]|nr:hypothetical protein [Gammaproteobacteria bacterium]
MKDSLWSVDLFRFESITLKSHWVLVVMDQFTRRSGETRQPKLWQNPRLSCKD